MFEVFYDFINEERIKSSTSIMTQVIDEWEHVFAKDVNLILLKCFMRFIEANGKFTHRISTTLFRFNNVLFFFNSFRE